MEQNPSMHEHRATNLIGKLRTRSFGHHILWYDQLDSTNTRATTWALEGTPEGSVVITNEQTAGRGRLGRTWQATPGLNATFSVVLRPTLPIAQLGLITIAASLAVAETLDQFVSPLKTAIKWPNDVYLNQKKCCGMLLESALRAGSKNTPDSVILGIGININEPYFPEELEHRATSLLIETGQTFVLDEVLPVLFENLENRYEAVTANAPAEIETYERRLIGLGREVSLRYSGTNRYINGRILGIESNGALRMETRDGVVTVNAGEVTTQPQ